MRIASLLSAARSITLAFNLSDMTSNNSAIHEAVQRLNSELESTDLLLLKSKPKFLSKKTHDDQEWPAPNDGPDALLPAALAANVEFQRASGSIPLVPHASHNVAPSNLEVPTEPQV